MTLIRVLLAEDHETVRHGLKLLIDGQDDMEVIGEASDGRTAVARARALRPDVIVIDIAMPEMNGLEAARALKENVSASRVVALTRFSDEAYVKQLLGAGAVGYVLKQSSSSELLRAIRAAATGLSYVDAAITTREQRNRESGQHSPAGQRPVITPREDEVLRLVAVGRSNKDIANALDISIKTVEVHKANAMRKLALRGRMDVIRFAVLQGWLKDP